MRLFVAVNFPDSVRRDAHDATAPLRRAAPAIRWVDPETMHVTLKFLGEVAEPRLPDLVAALEHAAASARGFTLRLGGVGAFPNFRRARVFWLGIQPMDAIIAVQESVEQSFAPLGFPREPRPFHPHLTLGRANQPSASELAAAERIAGDLKYEAEVVVNSIELMRSRLSPKGARYEVVRSATLM